MNIGILLDSQNRNIISPDTAYMLIQQGYNILLANRVEKIYLSEMSALKNYTLNSNESDNYRKIIAYIKKRIIETHKFTEEDYNDIYKKIDYKIKLLYKEKEIQQYEKIKNLSFSYLDKITAYDYIKQGVFLVQSNEIIIKSCELVTCFDLEKDDIQYISKKNIILCYVSPLNNYSKIKKISKTESSLLAIEYLKNDNNNYPVRKVISNACANVGFNIINLLSNRIGNLTDNFLFGKKNIVTILGYGTIGKYLSNLFLNLNYDVHLFEKENFDYSQVDKRIFCNLSSNKNKLQESIINSDIIISTIFNNFEICSKIVDKKIIEKINKKSILFDFTINQGGTFEGITRTHFEDTFNKLYTTSNYNKNVIQIGIDDLLKFSGQELTPIISTTIYPFILEIIENKNILHKNKNISESIIINKGDIIDLDYIDIEDSHTDNTIIDPSDFISQINTKNDNLNNLLAGATSYDELRLDKKRNS